jgi:hypothetical protein
MESLLVTIKDWLSEHGPLMLRRGFKEHYYHVGRREKDDLNYDPFQPQRAYPYGGISDWQKLFVKCESIAAVEKETSNRIGPRPCQERQTRRSSNECAYWSSREGLSPTGGMEGCRRVSGHALPESKVRRLVQSQGYGRKRSNGGSVILPRSRTIRSIILLSHFFQTREMPNVRRTIHRPPAAPPRRRAIRVNVRTIVRWENDPGLGLSQPIEINKRRYFHEAELTMFDRTRRPASSAA